eukprot:GCRY01008303.1.p1 GENE.GCRY01008303.1~~GCRY01008303.1.p1  ORF type:complete len:149 (-),score=19.49 GCRY01008303.1:63-509(-)
MVLIDMEDFVTHKVALKGDIKQLAQLAKQKRLNLKPDLYHWTPLHWACRNAHRNVVEFLLFHAGQDASTFINMQDSLGRTALHWACAVGDMLTVPMLLRRSVCARLCVRSAVGEMPIHWSAHPPSFLSPSNFLIASFPTRSLVVCCGV